MLAQPNKVIWYDAVPVADKTYGNIRPRIVLDKANYPLILWSDKTGRAFVAKWDGKKFGEPQQINTPGKYVFAESYSGPEITNHGDTLYLVYKGLPEDKANIFIKHSYDGGKTFSIETEVDEAPGYVSRFPTVAIDPYGHPMVAYMKLDADYTHPRYVVAKSKDFGESFLGEALVPSLSGGKPSDCCPATVIESGNATAILFRDDLNGLRNIWAGMSINTGVSFNRGVQVDTSNWMTKSCPAEPPHGIIVSDTLYSVYMSGGGDSDLVYLSKLSVSTLAASARPLTGSSSGLISQHFPRIAHAGNATAIAWQQFTGSNTGISMLFSNDITTGFDSGYNQVAQGLVANPDVAVGGGHVYLIWQDDSSGNILYKIGSYTESVANQLMASTTTITLTRHKSGKYFTVPLADMASCLMVDADGKEYEMEVRCRKNQCRVYTEDLDEGLYVVRIYGKDDKIYTYKYQVTEEVEKEKKEKKEK